MILRIFVILVLLGALIAALKMIAVSVLIIVGFVLLWAGSNKAYDFWVSRKRRDPLPLLSDDSSAARTSRDEA